VLGPFSRNGGPAASGFQRVYPNFVAFKNMSPKTRLLEALREGSLPIAGADSGGPIFQGTRGRRKRLGASSSRKSMRSKSNKRKTQGKVRTKNKNKHNHKPTTPKRPTRTQSKKIYHPNSRQKMLRQSVATRIQQIAKGKTPNKKQSAEILEGLVQEHHARRLNHPELFLFPGRSKK
jgi:hypothetical protein